MTNTPKSAQTNGRATITPPVSPFWTAADYAHETEVLRKEVWPAVQKFLAENWPGFSAAFTADDIVLCTYCRAEFEALGAVEALIASCRQDEHSVEGEPMCCAKAVDAFRAERGIPAVQWGGAA
ncbi:hypothetical protein [Streptomyces sp. NPDC005780]|uniref:hypothetical protein n=1 Tax=Streptomyces sp. NPDC005780 TaxID=3364730 RepID=UPI0036CF8838